MYYSAGGQKSDTGLTGLKSGHGKGCVSFLEASRHWSPTFLAPGSGFIGNNFSTDWRRGNRFRMIQAPCPYCALSPVITMLGPPQSTRHYGAPVLGDNPRPCPLQLKGHLLPLSCGPFLHFQSPQWWSEHSPHCIPLTSSAAFFLL